MGNNGNDKISEHPKSIITMLDNTDSAIRNYATTMNISNSESALILILNELRCIHWHMDAQMAKDMEEKK